MRLLSSELRKIWTAPRTVLGILLAELAIVGIGTASTIDGSNDSGAPPGFESLTATQLERDLISVVGSSLLFALILGVLIVTWEYRHGTITQTFLVTPVRERVVGAKVLVGALCGAALVLPALALMLVIAEIWVSSRLDFDGHDVQLMGRAFLAAAIVGALGVEIGSCTARQLGAIIVAFAWAAFVEPALSIWNTLGPYLPTRAIDAVLGTNGDEAISFGRGLLTALAYVAALGALALWLTRRRDIT
jgi:ABC-2 type transport system permease protein